METRKDRAKRQKLFLIETLPIVKNHERAYNVMGSTGNVYRVDIKQKPKCNCYDFRQRRLRCKHIYFVLIRIMKVNEANEDTKVFTEEQLAEMFSSIPAITQNLMVDNSKREKYKRLLNKKPLDGKSKEDLCPICLDDIENGEDVDYCKYSCGKYVHVECFDMWCKKKDSNCVFCRQSWHKSGQESDEYINLN